MTVRNQLQAFCAEEESALEQRHARTVGPHRRTRGKKATAALMMEADPNAAELHAALQAWGGGVKITVEEDEEQ